MANAVDITERYLQVLAVLRAAEGTPVPRAHLVAKVPAYAALAGDDRALKKLMQNDHKALRSLGFDVEDVVPLGEESRFVLRAGPWHLPVELTLYEQGLLVWVTATAGATAAQDEASGASGLLGTVPRALDLVQSALASGRSLLVARGDENVVFEPGILAARGGRWFVIGRYAGTRQLYGPRLDRLEVRGLGDVLPEPVPVPEPDEVLDATAWPEHGARDAELRCRTTDLGAVASWFPRAEVDDDGEESVLRFWYRNEEALVTRVIGLAGAVRIVEPAAARQALLDRVGALLQGVEA